MKYNRKSFKSYDTTLRNLCNKYETLVYKESRAYDIWSFCKNCIDLNKVPLPLLKNERDFNSKSFKYLATNYIDIDQDIGNLALTRAFDLTNMHMRVGSKSLQNAVREI